jgi:competence protein ComGF
MTVRLENLLLHINKLIITIYNLQWIILVKASVREEKERAYQFTFFLMRIEEDVI